MTQIQTHARSAFSLVELSIVLVILGLLVGGILGGQSLIRAAELRNITTEHQQWQTAINAFKMRYNALPGDFPLATRFWREAADCDAGWQGRALSTDGSTCNGDGNGRLSYAPVPGNFREGLTFWQHLANAGLVEGRYDAYHDNDLIFVAGRTVPHSRLQGASWIPFTYSQTETEQFPSQRGRDIFFFAPATLPLDENIGIISPEEAWGIDSKIDDGSPATGFVTTHPGDSAWPLCTETAAGATTTAASDDAQYRLGESSNACGLIFIR